MCANGSDVFLGSYEVHHGGLRDKSVGRGRGLQTNYSKYTKQDFIKSTFLAKNGRGKIEAHFCLNFEF